MKSNCYGCKGTGDLFNDVYHLDCFLEMSNYSIVELEPILFPEYITKKDLTFHNRLNSYLNRTCNYHRKKDCGWHYWWQFPNGVITSAFHSPLLSSLLDFYVELMTTIPEKSPEGRSVIYWHIVYSTLSGNIQRAEDYEDFALRLTAVKSFASR